MTLGDDIRSNREKKHRAAKAAAEQLLEDYIDQKIAEQINKLKTDNKLI